MNRLVFVFSCFVFVLVDLAAGSESISVLFDISRSTPSAELDIAKQRIQEMMEHLDAADEIQLYVFGNQLRKISRADLAAVRPAEGHTVLFDALYDVAREMAGSKASRKAIILVSDGFDTKSATIMEDIANYTETKGIVVYSIGVGKVNRKVLERLTKLTGGKYYPVITENLSLQLLEDIEKQKEMVAESPAPAPVPPVITAPEKPQQQPPPKVATPSLPQPEKERNYWWLIGIAGVVIVLPVFIFVLYRVLRQEPRTCPTCGRQLEPYQTLCPDCTAVRLSPTPGREIPTDNTQEILKSTEEPEEPIPLELLQKKPVTEESLAKTFVLMETPMLVVRKGKNVGQSFPLNRAFPVSIGRSHVNDIKLDDITVSGQHCRIIPENGKHVLYDLGSTNGTFVNEKRVQKTVLKEGDIIKVGETQFLYKIEQQRN